MAHKSVYVHTTHRCAQLEMITNYRTTLLIQSVNLTNLVCFSSMLFSSLDSRHYVLLVPCGKVSFFSSLYSTVECVCYFTLKCTSHEEKRSQCLSKCSQWICCTSYHCVMVKLSLLYRY